MDSRYRKGEMLHTNKATRTSVYRATDTTTNQPVIIKEVITPRPEAAQHFLKESWVQACLDHPNICKFYGSYFYKDGADFLCGLVMEPLPSDLQKKIDAMHKRNETFPNDTVWKYLQQLVSALALAQEKVSFTQCICHRDIKPLNLFVGDDDVIKVGDLGSAKPFSLASRRQLYSIQGTVAYLSPKVREQYLENLRSNRNQMVEHIPYKSDVFSLGLCCICMGLGDIPKELEQLNNLRVKLEFRIDSILGFSPELKSFIKDMVTVEEEGRPDFLALRHRLQGDLPLPVTPPVEAHQGRCLNCNHEREIDGDRIPMSCSAEHWFCQRQCLIAFVTRQTEAYSLSLSEVKCPLCKTPVDPQIVERAFGEYPPNGFHQAQSSLEECSYCHSMIQPLNICTCSHRFCLGCIKGMRKCYGKTPRKCPEDDTPFDYVQLKKHKAMCVVF